MKTRRSTRLSKTPLKSESEYVDSVIKEKKLKLNTNTSCHQQNPKLDASNVEKDASPSNGIVKSNLTSETNKQYDSDSSDSSNDYMQPPDTLDLNSDFFKQDLKQPKQTGEFSSIESKIFSGIQRLSDSENSSDFEELPSQETSYPWFSHASVQKSVKKDIGNKFRKKSSKKNVNNGQSSNTALSKDKLKSKDSEIHSNIKDTTDMDVTQLLALGEAKINTNTSVKISSCSENEVTDWEEVQEDENKEIKQEHSIPKEGVQITVDAPDIYHKRKKRDFDMEAFIKQQVNRRKRQIQVYVHKVNLLCWIAHGLFVNSVLNSETLMGLSLSLMPSQNTFPKVVNVNYLKQIAAWFTKTITLRDTFKEKTNLLSLHDSLQGQLENRYANSIRDLAFMFICLLRALGITSRLVISLQPVPLKPSKDDLCSANSKEKVTPKKIVKENETQQSQERSKKQPKSKQKTNQKVLSLEDAEKLRKRNVMSKEEALKRLKKEDGNSKNISKPKKMKIVKEENIKQSRQRSLRARNEVPVKYKDSSDTSDEDKIESNSDNVKNKMQVKNENKASNLKTNTKSKSSMSQTSIDKETENKNHLHERKEKLPLPSKGTTSVKKEESDSDFDYEITQNIEIAKRKSQIKKEIDRRVLSSDSDLEDVDDDDKRRKNNVWTEVYLDQEEKWVSVNVISGHVDCCQELYNNAKKPVTYIVAWNHDLTLKDVTRRYCTQFHTVTRRQRIDEEWWSETLFPFLTASTAIDKKEDKDMEKQFQERPLPTSIGEYKNHPLYALKRHLLKFQGIYPPNCPTLGFVRGEAVYPRDCVHTLHSREIWVKEAKVVRLGEQPYKIVKARPKYDRMSGKFLSDLPLELFGSWQVEDYIPPTATDGKVPRNAYGNVELFKACMLPKGTVHLQVPGLNRVARKLQIDCAPAVIAFDFHCGASHPVFDGFVVCEEYQDILLDAWNREQDEAARREQEKREKRVYGNWRRLIKGLFIRERLKLKYSFGEEETRGETEKKQENKRIKCKKE